MIAPIHSIFVDYIIDPIWTTISIFLLYEVNTIYVDNPNASKVTVRIGTADDDVRAVAKSKKPCTMSRYDFFKNGVPVVWRPDKEDTRCDWWLRSIPVTNDVSGMLGVSGTYLNEIDVNATKSIGVVPCFVIA